MNLDFHPILTQIIIYPIKSLDGIVLNQSRISTGGTLAFDRRWAIVDDRGKIVNAKRTAKIQQIRSQFDWIESTEQLIIRIQVGTDSTAYTFCLNHELSELAAWLSEFFGFAVSLIENTVVGFPDDLDAYGPTIISTATLEAVCGWFPDLNLVEIRRRFRTNLEITGVPAFWEDRLFDSPRKVVDFQLGDVQFYGINPCQRCIVPTRNSLTGISSAKFQQIFAQQRQQTISVEINASRFNHFYRLAVNTQIPVSETGKWLNTGDSLTLT